MTAMPSAPGMPCEPSPVMLVEVLPLRRCTVTVAPDSCLPLSSSTCTTMQLSSTTSTVPSAETELVRALTAGERNSTLLQSLGTSVRGSSGGSASSDRVAGAFIRAEMACACSSASCANSRSSSGATLLGCRMISPSSRISSLMSSIPSTGALGFSST